MNKSMVLIIDPDKLTKQEWKELFDKCVQYAAWSHPDDYQAITDFVDKTQDERAEKEYQEKNSSQ